MRTLKRIGVFALKPLGAIVIGDLLFHAVVRLPFNMPYGVDIVLRRALHLVGQDDLANPEDMEIIVGLAVAVVATAIGTVIVWGGHTVIRRVGAKPAARRSRTHRQDSPSASSKP